MTTPDIAREQQINDEWEEWAAASLRCLWEVCADEVPWHDARPSSEETT